uniref:hypothetical protein n=1 Tax=uncultured Aquimarina sp. TaxID=575652 RepID=UPI00260DC5A3
KNIKRELELTFPKFKVQKEIGQQDGPNFNLYEVTYLNEQIFFVSMDSYDSNIVQDLSTKHVKIKDEYDVSIGLTVDSLIINRPNLSFRADLHYNIYASQKNSKIEYRLKGNLKTLNDSLITADDYSVKKWQIEGMTVEYLIWRK